MRARLSAIGMWEALWSVLAIAVIGAVGWVLALSMAVSMVLNDEPDTVNRPCYTEYDGRILMLKCYPERANER